MKPNETQDKSNAARSRINQANEMTHMNQMKHMKLILDIKEHSVVTTAARMQGITVAEYLKKTVIAQAKQDAKEFSKVLEAI